jgi:hypothetical protein
VSLVDRELYPEHEFPAGQWDYMRYYEESFAEAIASMDANVYCRNLTEETIRSGHWLAQEKPVEVNAALVKWLATTVPEVWPPQK